MGRTGRHIAAIALLLAFPACSVLPRFERSRPAPRTARRTPIAKALDYMLQTQWTAERVSRADRRWIGNFPQTVESPGFPGRVTDISGGAPSYVHYSLCHINEDTAPRLGLTAADAARAREARRLTAQFLRRFQAPPSPAAFGWWPPDAQYRQTPARRLVGRAMTRTMGSLHMCGPLASPTIPTMPPGLWLSADSDDSAYVHMALHMDHELDGGAGPPEGLGALLALWRDDGSRARAFPPWLEPRSGAFVTWFTPRTQPRFKNDVDLVVLANCVWALAALGETDTPGYTESVRVLADGIRAGRHRCRDQVTLYYSSPYVLHALTARAYVEGPVPELAQAVQILADDVEARACGARWPGRTPTSNAACAISTLAVAGRRGPLLDAACRGLVRLQDPRTGAWPNEPIAFGDTSTGRTIQWRCTAAVTGTAMTALILAKIGPVFAR